MTTPAHHAYPHTTEVSHPHTFRFTGRINQKNMSEEDDFSKTRLAKALILTILSLVAVVLGAKHLSHVIACAYYGEYQSVGQFLFKGVAFLVAHWILSFQSLKFLNKVMFLKEDLEDLKKYQ